MQETWFSSLVGKIPWRRDRLPSPVLLGSPHGSAGKESTCNVGDLGLIPGLGISPEGGIGNPLQYSCLKSLIDSAAWWATVHGVAMKVKVAQSCLTLCDPMDYTVHGILQARTLEWGAFPFSRGSSQLRDQTQVSSIAGRFFTS